MQYLLNQLKGFQEVEREKDKNKKRKEDKKDFHQEKAKKRQDYLKKRRG